MGAGNLDWGPHGCTVNTLLTEPSPHQAWRPNLSVTCVKCSWVAKVAKWLLKLITKANSCWEHGGSWGSLGIYRQCWGGKKRFLQWCSRQIARAAVNVRLPITLLELICSQRKTKRREKTKRVKRGKWGLVGKRNEAREDNGRFICSKCIHAKVTEGSIIVYHYYIK